MKRIIAILPFLFIVGCASVATGIDTARNVVSTTVQTGMQAGADMVGAVAEDVSDVVSTTAEVAAGVVDQAGDANDDSFYTLGYSIAGVGIGYGNYDSDEDESTAISVKTSVAGLTVGYRHDDLDAATDNNMNTYSIGKDMGGMSLTLMYEEQDADDNEEWNLVYAMGF